MTYNLLSLDDAINLGKSHCGRDGDTDFTDAFVLKQSL
jgi:hypothetical protein